MGKCWYFHSSAMYGAALQAYERTAEALSDRRYVGNDVLVAIVFSALSLETFLNELPLTLDSEPPPKVLSATESALVADYVRRAEQLEQNRKSVDRKLLLAVEVLCANSKYKGTPAYQDFKLLVDLRNDLVHLKPKAELHYSAAGDYKMEPVEIIERLQSKDVLAEPSMGSWFHGICTRAGARWACNVAAGTVQGIVASLPDTVPEIVPRLLAWPFRKVE